MPLLVRFLLRHALIGVGLGALFVGALVLLDIGRLGTLAGQSASGLVALTVLTCTVGITFGSVQMGFAIMLMSEDESTPRTGRPAGTGSRLMKAAAVRVSARSGDDTHRSVRFPVA